MCADLRYMGSMALPEILPEFFVVVFCLFVFKHDVYIVMSVHLQRALPETRGNFLTVLCCQDLIKTVKQNPPTDPAALLKKKFFKKPFYARCRLFWSQELVTCYLTHIVIHPQRQKQQKQQKQNKNVRHKKTTLFSSSKKKKYKECVLVLVHSVINTVTHLYNSTTPLPKSSHRAKCYYLALSPFTPISKERKRPGCWVDGVGGGGKCGIYN